LDDLSRLSRDRSYVCFLPTKEDIFFVVWFTGPDQWSWEEDNERPHFFAQPGAGMLVQYKNGIFDENAAGPFWGWGKWVKYSKDTRATFEAARGDEIIKIDESSFQLAGSFKNQIGSKTKYSFTMQRSTGRFTETFEWESSNGNPQSDEHTGRCVVYKK
jgi:hypothetical protein